MREREIDHWLSYYLSQEKKKNLVRHRVGYVVDLMIPTNASLIEKHRYCSPDLLEAEDWIRRYLFFTVIKTPEEGFAAVFATKPVAFKVLRFKEPL